MGMNREILRIALPNIISNITVPIMGIAGTMIAGHLGDSVTTIGSLAIGVSIFNFIYWNCSFIRMGTSGLTAQAYGAGDNRTTTLMLLRAVLVSMVIGVIVLLLQKPLGQTLLWISGLATSTAPVIPLISWPNSLSSSVIPVFSQTPSPVMFFIFEAISLISWVVNDS